MMKQEIKQKEINGKKSISGKFSKKFPILIGAGIFGIIVAHFVFQMFFIQAKQFQAVEVAVQTENVEVEKPTEEQFEEPAPQIINIFPAVYEVQKIKVVFPEKAEISPRRQIETAPVVRNVPKKKIVREKENTEKKERLRRAEKILTGF